MESRTKIQDYVHLCRPFTLVVPAVGMVTGGLTAYGARPALSHIYTSNAWFVAALVAGSCAAAILNMASNAVNQIYDLPADRVNKPHRPIPAGRITTRHAARFAAICYALALGISAVISVWCFVIFLVGALFTIAYSAPPLRIKRFGWTANLAIALPRGLLLKVAGWSLAKGIFNPEAWLIGGLFGLFVFGSVPTKDFSDIEGDRIAGCNTLPVRYGPRRAAQIVHGFLVIGPLAVIPFAATGMLSGDPYILCGLALILSSWGHYVGRRIIETPARQLGENHPAWKNMYMMMALMHIGFAAAYLV